jgi:hypothetical protein
MGRTMPEVSSVVPFDSIIVVVVVVVVVVVLSLAFFCLLSCVFEAFASSPLPS